MASFKMYDHQKCKKYYFKYRINIHDNQMCAIPANNREKLAPVNILIYFQKVVL